MEKQFSFHKSERLCGELRINRLFDEGQSFIVYPIRVCWQFFPETDEKEQADAEMAADKCAVLQAGLETSITETEHKAPVQILISVPKKRFKRANKRNRIKRLIREAYRLQKAALITQTLQSKGRLQIAFVWLSDEEPDYPLVFAKTGEALDKISGKLCR